jgi:HNH endonuclease
MARSRRQQVWQRAGGWCEYCHMPQALTVLPHEIDHIRARKHRGSSALENLALACAPCNARKGSNAAGYDPEGGDLTPLFNPRHDCWTDHFSWDGPVLKGKTPVARATIDVLGINEPDRVEHRRMLLSLRLYPRY